MQTCLLALLHNDHASCAGLILLNSHFSRIVVYFCALVAATASGVVVKKAPLKLMM